MEIESTPLFQEASRIMESGSTTANVSWKTRIHYGDGQVLDPIWTVAVNNHRDYRTAFADIKTITVTMGLGDYARLIYPNRVGLEITLTKLPYLEQGSEIDVDADIETERYSAVLLDGPRSATIGQGSESNDIEALNLSQIIDVNFQIFDKALEQVRVMLCGGIYRNCDVENVIKTVLTNQATKTKVPGQKSIVGVDMVPADNKDIKGQVVLTHGTKLIDAPDFVQRRVGVYNSGLGSYIQNLNWFIYPLYDTTDFQRRKKTVTVLVLPKRKYASIERTFSLTGDSLIILATGETAFKDDSGTNYVNTGNGIRFADANTIMADAAAVSGNKAIVVRNENNSEYVADEGVNGINHAALSSRRITANPFIELSHLAAKKGGLFKCNWQNSDSSLLIPGMAAKIIYADGEDVKQIYGILHVVFHTSHRSSGFGSDRFMNQSVLSFFVNGQVVPLSQ